jgi:hypothetical protein
MAHFAQLDENNVVLQVIVVNNEELMDGTDESEVKGIAFCQELFGSDTIWRQTSYNNRFRARYAAIGGVYDPVKDVFISPKFFPSWVLNEETTEWEAPVPYPDDGNFYTWNESTLSWDIVLLPTRSMGIGRDLPPEEAP